MSLADKIKLLQTVGNEIAIGYSDSGCFWRLTYGNRGAGSMMDIKGVNSLDAVDCDDFEEAVDYFLAQLGLA